MQNKLGLYIHVPFCGTKCPYCSFFSCRYSKTASDEYCEHMLKTFKLYSQRYSNKTVDTVYFGGGTPSLLGTARLITLLNATFECFNCSGEEITIEVNPLSGMNLDYSALFKAGLNRVSIGMQSVNSDELSILGRKHTADTIKALVYKIRQSGIDNISLDLMCCIPNQDITSLKKSIHFCKELDVNHISAYMLKIEEGTAFYQQRDLLNLPSEDDERNLYLYLCNELKELGYKQYEISNFSKPGFESKHNLKYWNCDDYLGLGPSAHSLVDGERFFYKDDFLSFYNNVTEYESEGADAEEYAMLRLRLREGIKSQLYFERYHKAVPKEYFTRAKELKTYNLARVTDNSISLTPEGFLLSNLLTAKILWG